VVFFRVICVLCGLFHLRAPWVSSPSLRQPPGGAWVWIRGLVPPPSGGGYDVGEIRSPRREPAEIAEGTPSAVFPAVVTESCSFLGFSIRSVSYGARLFSVSPGSDVPSPKALLGSSKVFGGGMC